MRLPYAGKMVPFAGWSMPIQYKDSPRGGHAALQVQCVSL